MHIRGGNKCAWTMQSRSAVQLHWSPQKSTSTQLITIWIVCMVCYSHNYPIPILMYIVDNSFHSHTHVLRVSYTAHRTSKNILPQSKWKYRSSLTQVTAIYLPSGVESSTGSLVLQRRETWHESTCGQPCTHSEKTNTLRLIYVGSISRG